MAFLCEAWKNESKPIEDQLSGLGCGPGTNSGTIAVKGIPSTSPSPTRIGRILSLSRFSWDDRVCINRARMASYSARVHGFLHSVPIHRRRPARIVRRISVGVSDQHRDQRCNTRTTRRKKPSPTEFRSRPSRRAHQFALFTSQRERDQKFLGDVRRGMRSKCMTPSMVCASKKDKCEDESLQ